MRWISTIVGSGANTAAWSGGSASRRPSATTPPVQNSRPKTAARASTSRSAADSTVIRACAASSRVRSRSLAGSGKSRRTWLARPWPQPGRRTSSSGPAVATRRMGVSASSALSRSSSSSDSSSACCRSSTTIASVPRAASSSRTRASTACASPAPCSGRPDSTVPRGLSEPSAPRYRPSSAATSEMRRSPKTSCTPARSFTSASSAGNSPVSNRACSNRAITAAAGGGAPSGIGAAADTRRKRIACTACDAIHSSMSRDFPAPRAPTTVTACGTFDRAARPRPSSSTSSCSPTPTNDSFCMPLSKVSGAIRPKKWVSRYISMITTPRCGASGSSSSGSSSCLRATPLVTHRDLEAWALLTAPFFLFPASDLFDDPRFEHGESPSLHACNISSY